MSPRLLAASGALILVTSVLVAGQNRAAGATAKRPATTKTWRPPLTPYGQPELEGVWVNTSATPLERPKALEGRPYLTDEEVAELKERAVRLFKDGHSDLAGGDNFYLATLANPERYNNPNATSLSYEMVDKEFENRTSLIAEPADGRIPWLAPDAQRQQVEADAARLRLAKGPEDLSNAFRCVTYGVPRLGGRLADPEYSHYEILQTPAYVVVMTEAIHDPRIIPLDGRPHLPQHLRQWNGDSIGRWERGSLVVDTTNFSAQSNFMGSTDHLHLIERFTRAASDTIDYEITLIDPTVWTRPWTAVLHLKRASDQIFEFACHEGNYQMMIGILAGARATEAAAEGATQRSK